MNTQSLQIHFVGHVLMTSTSQRTITINVLFNDILCSHIILHQKSTMSVIVHIVSTAHTRSEKNSFSLSAAAGG